MEVLRVFTNENGEFGNPVGIVIDASKNISNTDRQIMASKSGFSEIVFINDLVKRDVSIFSPQREIPFAGHALVGTASFLNNELNSPITEIISMGKTIKTWSERKLTWVQGDLSILPEWNFEELSNSSSVDALTSNLASKKKHTVVWAWIDENKGIIRARTFATDWGIPEDEANGSGSMKLASTTNRELVIHHGKGSVIHARPLGNYQAAVGGLVLLEKEQFLMV